jgi:RNA polymerase sigma factor (sigma-70 family)
MDVLIMHVLPGSETPANAFPTLGASWLVRKIRRLSLGHEAETAVGQERNQLLSQGFRVYHDISGDTRSTWIMSSRVQREFLRLKPRVGGSRSGMENPNAAWSNTGIAWYFPVGLRRSRFSRLSATLIQEAMLRLHTYTGEDVRNKEAFLRCAVRNLAIDQYRRDRSRLQGEVPIDDVDQRSPLIAPGPTPDQILDDQQRLDELIARLYVVNPRTREIYLAHRSGYSHAEIADHMNIAKITVNRSIAHYP